MWSRSISPNESYNCIDEYCGRIEKIKEASGKFQYQQLLCLKKRLLPLNHGNRSAERERDRQTDRQTERGSSINDNILSVYGSFLGEKCITALRIGKDEINRVRGVRV